MSREGENGAYCCNREGAFVCGGWKCCLGGRECLVACLKDVMLIGVSTAEVGEEVKC